MRLVIGFFIFCLMVLSVITGHYTVDQRQVALVFTWGELKDISAEPGLYFKMPMPLQDVKYIDRRLQTAAPKLPDRLTTSDGMSIFVDSFVKWRMTEPLQFYKSFGTDMQRASDQIVAAAKIALNEEIPKYTAAAIVSGDRSKLISAVLERLSAQAKTMGLEIFDVKIRRVMYADQINQALFEKMKSEQARLASEQRATGDAEAERIKAEADREATVILAEAFREAEKIKGEGDAKAARIYSKAFQKDPEFYRFYRAMQAYRESFKNKKDVMVVDPSSEFFRYMKDPKGQRD